MVGVNVVMPAVAERAPDYRVKYPVELEPSRAFRIDERKTWPRLAGRLEYVKGRLLYMPPCGDEQQEVAAALVFVLMRWARARRDFVVGSNEAGMVLGGDVRGADAAVWRRSALGARTGGFRRVAPVLAAEVAGRDEGEPELFGKAEWYLSHGVEVVWLLFPRSRAVVVITPFGQARFAGGKRLPKHASLPSLAPAASDFFRQLAP